MARTEDGAQTVLLGAPLPGTDAARFAAEAEAARYLLGPWIAPVTGVAGPGEPPWYATPYLPALPLPV
ncbi:serine/threonine protein kinase, partial [Streptomyces sp. NPDC012693]